MAKCDAILQEGIFNTVVTDTSRTFSENYVEWLKSASYEEIKSKSEGGMSIAFPIDGVPIEFKAEVTEDDYRSWKSAVDAGRTRDLSTQESSTVVERSVDQGIVDAWRECVNSFGLLNYETVGADGTFRVYFRYGPNSEDDDPPTVTELVVVNATCQNPPSPGEQVPFGGFTLLFSRTRNEPGFFPEAAYILNTTKGSADGTIPRLGDPQTPRIRSVRTFHSRGSRASWPSAEVSVLRDYKLICGGARVNWNGAGNLLTSSYPVAIDRWRATGKDHMESSPSEIDVWAIALHDPDDELEVVIDSADSAVRNHPERIVSARGGFQLVGGGARATWNTAGQLLTASCPVGRDSWLARSKDHEVAEVNFVTSYAISMRPRNGAPAVPIEVRQITTAPAAHPEGACSAPDGCRLIGGGAQVNWGGAGNLLTASYPDGNSWVAKAKDHRISDHASLTVFAIGILEEYFA